jgi:hypothetical protein
LSSRAKRGTLVSVCNSWGAVAQARTKISRFALDDKPGGFFEEGSRNK